MRRQNRCCDQCRKAKRACDAPSVWDRQRFYTRPAASGGDAASGGGPPSATDPGSPAPSCSNCLRRGKNCTFHWLKRQQRTGSRSQGSATTNRYPPDTIHSPPYPRPPRLQQEPPEAQVQEAVSFGAASVTNASWTTAGALGPIPGGQNAAIYNAVGIDAVAAFDGFEPPSYPAMQTMQVEHDLDAEAAFLDAIVEEGSPGSETQFLADSGAEVDDFSIAQAQNLDYNLNQSSRTGYYRGSTWPPMNEPGYPGSQLPTDLSPYSMAYSLDSSTNKSLITCNLMRVYNDSFELALACCLSPEVCPYDLDKAKLYPANGISWIACHHRTVTLSKQYDPRKQDNGVYHAVTKLDQAARACRLVVVTKEQDKLIAKALLMVMMAYATQWAQGSNRELEVYPQNLYSCADYLDGDFDYFLHKTLWMQAKRALDECANIECFRVACAEWIMGLIQRPMGQEEIASYVFDGSENGVEVSVASQVKDILSAEGPPLFTEQAARKVHALKFRYDTQHANILDPTLGYHRPNRMEKEDLGTFNLVYWMTVMLDSISSAMCGRPIVVSDSECQHDPEYLQHPERELYALEYRPQDPKWWDGVFDQGHSTENWLRWPCPQETAIKAIVAATPIKVVIFRQASYLQGMLGGNCRGEPIEKIISNAIALCRHWNMTYSTFVRTFMERYEETPIQLQMWFIHVVSYFYFGTLLFVDLIETVDQQGLGFASSRQERQNIGLVPRLRSECLTALSDLAHVSTMSSTDDLHFAIAKQSILPEPWSGMLIRAFSKAAIMQLDDIYSAAQHDPMSLGGARMLKVIAQCESCIKALYCLGKKSDVARAVRRVLYSALNPYLMQNY